jgi:hypothetical protein
MDSVCAAAALTNDEVEPPAGVANDRQVCTAVTIGIVTITASPIVATT